MAKKQTDKVLVECLKCAHGGHEAVNLLTDCFNKERNPHGYKVGSWPRECNRYKAR